MGLDTYATRNGKHGSITVDDLAAFAATDVNLCGGLFSSNGEGASFRGKVYAQLVERITGKSLYDIDITPTQVATMTMMLRAARDALVAHIGTLPPDLADDLHAIQELSKFFSVCSERGLGLAGDW